MRISVLTPTYNDAVSIEETLESLVAQTYTDWEWIVINDGSTDGTEEKIQELIQKYGIAEKCKYISQANADQLNALIHGTQYITGDYVFTLHSDDLLPEKKFFEKCVRIMEKHPNADGLFGNLVIIDEHSKVTGMQKVKEYHPDKNILPLMLLWLGRNLYSDVAFHKASVYKNEVLKNYLTWNIPLWLDLEQGKARMLNYISVDFPVLKYRVHSANYANSELGLMNVINGELRTATELMKYYDIPCYKQQYFLFRLMNKLQPQKEYRVKYAERETRDKYQLVSFIIGRRYPDGVSDNPFLSSILEFYRKPSERILKMEQLRDDLTVYYGKDVRAFNRRMSEGTLDKFYTSLMEEMKRGFQAVEVSNSDDRDKMKDILKFMCIGHIEVRIES